MMKENINEHDFTKKMIEIMKGGYKSRLLNEADNQGDTLNVTPNDAIFGDELNKLRDIVDSRVEITNFKIYPLDKNVIIEGVFMKQESPNSGIHFKMSLTAGNIETTMNDIDLDDNVSDLLHRLKGYYEKWVREWATKITDEYKPKND